MDIEKAANIAIQNVIKEGLTDIFDRPFEVDLLKNIEFQHSVRETIIKSIKSNSISGLGMNIVDYILFPKNSPFSFRH